MFFSFSTGILQRSGEKNHCHPFCCIIEDGTCIINSVEGVERVEVSIENSKCSTIVVVHTLRKDDDGMEYCWSFVLVQMVEEDSKNEIWKFNYFVKEL